MAKSLVAYFSATGTTGRVARKLAEAADADLYEIKPKTPYTSADLNWNNSQSRSSIEMNDLESRPELADHDARIADYETIFIGLRNDFHRISDLVVHRSSHHQQLPGRL